MKEWDLNSPAGCRLQMQHMHGSICGTKPAIPSFSGEVLVCALHTGTSEVEVDAPRIFFNVPSPATARRFDD